MVQEILKFWFEEIDPSQWWKKDSDFDRLIIQRFAAVHAQAARCELYAWRKEPRGRLAEVIVLDQFSRNMFRDMPQAFAHDALALALAQEAVSAGADTRPRPSAPNAAGARRTGWILNVNVHEQRIPLHLRKPGLPGTFNLIGNRRGDSN